MGGMGSIRCNGGCGGRSSACTWGCSAGMAEPVCNSVAMGKAVDPSGYSAVRCRFTEVSDGSRISCRRLAGRFEEVLPSTKLDEGPDDPFWSYSNMMRVLLLADGCSVVGASCVNKLLMANDFDVRGEDRRLIMELLGGSDAGSVERIVSRAFVEYSARMLRLSRFGGSRGGDGGGEAVGEDEMPPDFISSKSLSIWSWSREEIVGLVPMRSPILR